MALKSHAIKTTNYQMTFWVIKVLRSMAIDLLFNSAASKHTGSFDDMWSWNAPLQHNLPHNTQSERLRNIWLVFSIGEHVCQGLSACSWSCRRFANFYFSCPRIKQRDGGRIFRKQRLPLRRSRRNSKSWISSQDKIQLNEVPFQKMERTQEGKHMEDEWKRKGSVFSTRGRNGKRQTVRVDCKNVLQHHGIVEYDSM